ncbi:TetR family transcriptional regulator [Amycolatopsis sp. GM8]|uniref:TetR family transcriptional regulator n=1 Tax=Amycolatopsis sp. GM8 TaxID=2896530 RepID=UPI001EFF61A7|nr:TetR family transcriptional regulator [Amycolatopsis sp. GM8]
MSASSDARGVDGRGEHKQRTREALIDAALTLFAAKGYEATSVDEIADWAGVSPRTFFRYFDSKDRVLFFGGDAYNAAVVRQLPDQPAELGDLAAVAATQRALSSMVAPLKNRIRLYFRAVQDSPQLLGQHSAALARHEASLADALATRRSLRAPDARCRMTAELVSIAIRHAYAGWLSSKRDLAEHIDEGFALLREIACQD